MLCVIMCPALTLPWQMTPQLAPQPALREAVLPPILQPMPSASSPATVLCSSELRLAQLLSLQTQLPAPALVQLLQPPKLAAVPTHV